MHCPVLHRQASHRPRSHALKAARATLRATAAGSLLLHAAYARPAAEPATISFHQAVADAWALLPARANLAARQAVAAARNRTGAALLPDAPALAGSFVNDRIAGSNNGYITSQVELSTPVWLPGEGSAIQAAARAEGTAAGAATEAAHLDLAAELLARARRAELAANARDVAAGRLATARALAASLARQLRVGEAAEADSLAADADAASAETALSTAETELAGATAALAALTGSEQPVALATPGPAALTSALADQPGDALARHPRIRAAERAVAAAQENARLVRIQDRDDPQLGVQGINEKQPGTRWDTRFGVTLRFSFATEARNGPRRAEADQATTQAMVQLAVARREVELGVRQAAALRAGTERGAAAAARAAAALARRRGQIERAWRLGEMPLIELVRADAAAADADLAARKAATERDSARLALILAQGVLP